ncbi:ABC transporter ATP-binding protein [Ottowia testudinis]|uniref:ABC transporter ATP-binding protein n=1 Tax=Ottowia testudinis TaxID=2816950 RepID=A0A975CFR5_9BURK|nr:ABC transporter ATP-binding protein [Ottowia testudinis]QTD44261.1 ABC transporter ATP-binding protein [Ottowia testudinis]
MLGRFERLLPPYPEPEPELPPKGFLAFVWRATAGLRGYIGLMALLSAGTSIYDALLFALLGFVVDWLGQVAPSQLWAERGGVLLWLSGVLLASIALVALQTTVKHQTLAINFPLRLRWNFHRLMLGQSMAFYADEFAGRITTKIMQTALAVRDMIFTTADVVIGMGVYMVTILLLAAGFDGWLMLPFLLWAVAYGLACWYFVPRLSQVSRAQADARSVMTGRITDAYTNIATVKLFSHTRREAQFARAAMEEFRQTGYAQMRLVSLFETVNHALIVALILAACGTALWLWSIGQVGTGAVAAVTAMALRLSGMSHWVMWEMTSLFESVGTIQDGINTLSRPRAVVDAPGAHPLMVTRGEVRFDDVSFSYRDGARPVIEQLNLTIHPGEKVGLIGRSGAGKSTLVNLLLRFHDVQKGRILIDGQDIAHVTQDSLRQAIGMVTQDTSLLHRAMRDNILYGRPDATEDQMLTAARRAQAGEFIDQLTDLQGRRGYDAQVGERGVKLSGGQRQRVAIARVMLKDAPILLLDEATSALDSEVEAAIQESLQELMKGKTVIAIAHRLSTIAALDRLIVLDAGRVVEQGTHAELLAQGGIYASLWARQSGGFLGEQGDGGPT